MHNPLHYVGVWVTRRATALFIAAGAVCFSMVLVSSMYTNYWKRRQAAVLRARARSPGRRVRFAQ